MRNPWKVRQPTGAEMWDEAQRQLWAENETDRLMMWWWSLPGMAAALVLGSVAMCGALGWLG